MERVEVEVLEAVDGAWCDGLSTYGADELAALSDLLVSVQGLSVDQSSATATNAVDVVSHAVSSLRRCGGVVLQCTSALSSMSEASEAARLRVLECVRGLSCDHLDSASADASRRTGRDRT